MTLDDSPPEVPKRSVSPRIKIVAAVIVVVALVIVARTVDLPDPEAIRDSVSSAGAWGVLLFVLLYAVLSSTPFPASTLTIASGLLFGLVYGATIVVVSATLGAWIAYWFARSVGRGSMERTRWSRVQRLNAMLERRGFMSVLIVRLIPVFPFALVSRSEERRVGKECLL